MSIEVNSFIDLGLKIDETNNNPKNILLLGNTKGFFGSCSEDKNIFTNACGDEETIKNNYFWLENEYNVCNSNLYIIGDTDVCNYYHHIISDMASMMGKKPKYKYMDINICAKKKGISEEKEIEKYYVNILKEQQGKRMKFDKIIMNPPYDNGLGGKITFEVISLLKDDKDCICLMPLSNYKNKSAKLWRKVKTLELADPKMFDDADITKNLCICTIENKNVDKYRSYEDIEMESYDPRFKVFYEVNKQGVGDFSCTGIDSIKINKLSEYNQDTAFYVYSRTAGHGVHKSGYDVEYNVNKSIGIDGLPLNTSKGHNNLIGGFIVFTKKTGKDNFTLWWYKGEGELADKAIHSMNKNIGSIEPAIPQIDWETISDNPLWKEGKYDEAVLDVMDLMWDEEKNNIVRKII